MPTLQITTALVYCLLSVGICFGFAALKPILIASGVYLDRCTKEPMGTFATWPNTNTLSSENDGIAKCVEQEITLNQMFTWAAVGTNVSAFPIGLILDRYGPRVASMLGTVLMLLGSLGLAIARADLDIYIPAYTVLAMAGSFLLLASFSLASLVPRRAGLIVSGMTGAFDASSGLFLIYRIVYQSFGGPSITHFFSAYCLVPILIFVVQAWYMPRRTTDDSSDDIEHDEGREELSETTHLLAASEAGKTITDPVEGVMVEHNYTAGLTSGWFLGPAFVMIASLIRVNFYIATVHAQLIFFIGSADAQDVKNMFDVLLPLGGILAIPLIGWIIDNYTTATVYLLTLLLSLSSGLLSFVPNKYVQILHVLTFVVLRPWIYSILPGTVTRIFGNERFGAFYGLIMAIAGLVNLLAHDLEVMTYTKFDGSFIPVNAGLVSVSITMLVATVFYMKYKIGKMRD